MKIIDKIRKHPVYGIIAFLAVISGFIDFIAKIKIGKTIILSFLSSYLDVLYYDVKISVWLFIILLILSIYPLFRLGKRLLSFFIGSPPKQIAMPESPKKMPEKNKKTDEVSKDEKDLLIFFATIDDGSLTIPQIAEKMQTTKLRAKNTIEILQRKGFVRISSMPYSFGNTEYKLNILGRDFIVKNGLDNKKSAELDKTEERILKYIHGSQEVNIGEFAEYMPEIPDDELNVYIEELVKGRYIKKSRKFSRIWLDEKGKQYLIDNKLINP